MLGNKIMLEINPDPYKDGDPLGPTGRMTAIFDSLADLKAAIPEVEAEGFKGEDFAIYLGVEAAVKFDSRGKFRDIAGLKIFQNAVCDEMELFEQFEDALFHGGAVVAIRTGDDNLKKDLIIAILKAHHARKVNYWGKWHYEALA